MGTVVVRATDMFAVIMSSLRRRETAGLYELLIGPEAIIIN